MGIRSLAPPALAAAALLGAAAAMAQTAAPRVTDVGPPPAEERDSAGAVLLEKSPVPAQRKAFAESAARTGVVSVGRGVMRATTRARTAAALASARQAEAAEFRRRGAGALTGD
ncbi:hypothetical protein ACFPOE_03450 [Caenimonas terrae]|uniref:DUF4148 domain-containing protein n=1 Tax=Caenimonas terrae TaxID=696074 RepID=A0ABW0N9S1_9BURK